MQSLVGFRNLLLFTTLIWGISSFSAPIDQSVDMIEEITKCKMVITSGYRTPKHNKEVGGAPNSLHLVDRARDIVPKKKKCISFKKLAKIACELKLNVIEYSRHVHIDNRENPKCTKGRYKNED